MAQEQNLMIIGHITKEVVGLQLQMSYNINQLLSKELLALLTPTRMADIGGLGKEQEWRKWEKHSPPPVPSLNLNLEGHSEPLPYPDLNMKIVIWNEVRAKTYLFPMPGIFLKNIILASLFSWKLKVVKLERSK